MTLFQRKTRVLMVCTENICRSPMAEGLLRHHLQQCELRNRVTVSSAGTRTSQPGCRPDQRAQRAAAAAGVKLGRIKSRRITEGDFVHSDYIFAMDHANMRDMDKMCPAEHRHKISLLLGRLSGHNQNEVPDPYFGSVEGFGKVFRLIDAAVVDLLPLIADQT